MSYATQRKTGDEQNRLYKDDLPIHEWYRFVLSFPAHLVRNYIEQFNLSRNSWVLDPFCGTGTTIVECKKHGIPSIGLEANPVVHYLAKTKCNWSIEPEELKINAREIAERATSTLKEDGIEDNPVFITPDIPDDTELRRLPETEQKLLIKDSISEKPLHKALVLREAIEELAEPEFIDHHRLAFARELVYSISNLRFGPEVGTGKTKVDVPVVSTWLTRVDSIAEDLSVENIQEMAKTPSFVKLADSRHLDTSLEPLTFDAVITSPPYPNEKDYSRTTRLESVILGFMTTSKDLRKHKKTFVRSNTRGVYKADEDDKWLDGNERVMELARTIEERRIGLGKTSGFERLYHRVVKLYFGGMAKHLKELRRVLSPGAHLAYVVGDQASYLRVMIRTGELLGSIAEDLGYEVVSRDIFRTRFSTATQEELNEEVLVLRWR
jgi:DNA modification methylase